MQSRSDDNEWNAPWSAKMLAVYDCHDNLVVHTGITGNRSRPPDDLVRMASMIAEAVNKHLTPDGLALNHAPQLKGKKAVVLYFDSDADVKSFVDMIHEVKPGMRTERIR